MRIIVVFSLVLVGLSAVDGHASPLGIELGTAGSFGILAGSTVTNTGTTTIHGNVGVSPGTAVTGFPPGIVTTGVVHAGDSVAAQAHTDLTVAYAAAAAAPAGTVMTGQDLGGQTLMPGTYTFASSAGLTGALTLDARGDAQAAFLFQIGSTLTSASNASVVLVNGGRGGNVVFQVGSSATLGSGTVFAGSILAATSITLQAGTVIQSGRALARDGAVTLSANDVSVGPDPAAFPVPEPGAAAMLGLGILMAAAARQPLRRYATA